jgi:acetylornithine deacetylase
MKFISLLFAAISANWPVQAYSNTAQQPLHPISDSLSSLLSLHKSLVEYSSITGNESTVTDFLVSYLQDQSFTVETQLVSPATSSDGARHNIFAYIGKSRKTRTLVTSHIDTVPPFWPYERRAADEIWGRGSVDAKGSVATQIKAVEDLLEAKKISAGDVALLFVVGEETGGDGMRAANHLGLGWDAVIFGEPTELKLASGHKGSLGVRITAKGKAGHSGYPELGRNANSMLVKLLYELERVEFPSSEKYGNTTLNVGTINGGVAANVIAEEAVATVQIRIAAGEPEDIKNLIMEAAYKLAEPFDLEFTSGYGPIDIDHDVEGMFTRLDCGRVA